MKVNEAPEKVYLLKIPISGELDEKWLSDKSCSDDVEYIRKDALVKYLYEEKGYPISLNGELVHWDELTKHLAEYYNWRKNVFIENVIKYLYDNDKGFILTEKDIEDFRKYLKKL